MTTAREIFTKLSIRTDTNDASQGTNELYFCEQCCVDWNTCPIDTSNCDFVPMPGSPNPIIVLCGPSPIIIDTEHEGFHLTSADAGVVFDISGTGNPISISWRFACRDS